LIDLRQKVNIYERELKLISENSGAEIDALQKQIDMYKRREQDVKLNQHIQSEIDQTNTSKTKTLLVATKTELEQAARTIKELNHEIQVQQEFYEAEL